MASKKKSAPAKVKKSTAKMAKRGKALTATAAAPHLGVAPGHKPEFAAAATKGCLDKGSATLLVFSCTGVGAVDPQTTLDVLSAGDANRRQDFADVSSTRLRRQELMYPREAFPVAGAIPLRM